MQKLKEFFAETVKRIFTALFGRKPDSAGEVVLARVDDRDPDSIVQLVCLRRDCANHNRDSMDCNCKHILIAEDGSCKTFIPADGKYGEFLQ